MCTYNELVDGFMRLAVISDEDNDLINGMKGLEIDRRWSDPVKGRTAPSVYRINGHNIGYKTLCKAKEVAQCHPECDAIVYEDGLYYMRRIPESDRRSINFKGTIKLFSGVILYPKNNVVTWVKVINKRKRLMSYE